MSRLAIITTSMRPTGEHDRRFLRVVGIVKQVPQLDHETIDVHTLGDDQTEIERRLQPAAEENQTAERLRAWSPHFAHWRLFSQIAGPLSTAKPATSRTPPRSCACCSTAPVRRPALVLANLATVAVANPLLASPKGSSRRNSGAFGSYLALAAPLVPGSLQ